MYKRQGQTLLVQAGSFFLQTVLQFGVPLGAEQLAENAAALLGGGIQDVYKRQHGR